METINPSLSNFLLNSLWQIPLVAATAMLTCRLMLSGPAAHRHLVWVAALVAALFLPLASIGTAEWDTSERLTISLKPPASVGLPSDAFPSNGTVAQLPAPTSRRTISFTQTTISLAIAAYGLFVLYGLVRLVWAWMRTVQIRRSSRELDVPPQIQRVIERCLAAFSQKNVDLLWSATIPSPVTAGVLRRVIILPDCLLTDCLPSESSTDVLGAAIGHEMAHIARKDFAMSLVYELLYLPVSFHPAAWFVRQGIAQTRELACDELVTRKLLDAGTYARSIVSIAAVMKGLPRPGYTLGVFDGDNLEERIASLVKRPVGNRKHARLLLAGGLSAIAACVVIASGLSLTARAQGGSYGEMKLAQTAYNAGDFRSAVQHFENAVNLDPANPRPKLFLAGALLREFAAGKSEDGTLLVRARKQYADVLAYEPQNQFALRGMMQLAVDSKQIAEAHEWALKLIQADPKNKSAYYTAGVMTWAAVFPEFQRAKLAAGGKVEDYSISDSNVRKDLRDKYLPQVDEGLGMLQTAVQIDPGYDDAMAYINLLCRLKAGLVDSPTESAGWIAQADDWVHKALALKRQHASGGRAPERAQLDVDGQPPESETVKSPPPPPPPPPPASSGNQIASAVPPVKGRSVEQQSPFWQVVGTTDLPAMTLFQDLKSKGFRAALFASREDNLVRVMVGPYFDEQSLKRAKSEIEAAGFRPLRVW